MMQDELEKLLREAIQGITDVRPLLERPQEEGHGDYSSNIALVVAKQTKRNPREVAQEILSKLQKPSFLEKVEVADPGFLNFFLSSKYLLKEMDRVMKEKDSYGASAELKGQKIILEFTDPNPFKEFHVGHIYTNIVGESLSKLFEFQGATVKRANYYGDVGMHVAKAIWGMQKNMQKEKISLQDLSQRSLRERARFLGESYAQGSSAFEEDETAKKEIASLNAKIFAKDKEISDVYEQGKTWSLEYFETLYKRLGTAFDFYYAESQVSEQGKKLVLDGLKKGIFEESEGAVVFPGEKYGLHKRVFINSQGLPTYEAKELGLAPKKYEDFKYDKSIIITGNEVTEYFKVLKAALALLHPSLAEKTFHIGHGMVVLPSGKMSSRKGNIIRAPEFLDEVKEKVLLMLESSEHPLPAEGREEVAEAIALGAVKYSLLKVGVGKDIVFDMEKSLSLAGDSGPYLQYAYARCKSILRKAGEATYKKGQSFTDLFPEEVSLLRTLSRFPEVAREAAEKQLPSLVCSFAFTLAKQYSAFYDAHSVMGAESQEKKEFRLLLTTATAQVLKNSLSLLGIRILERM
ncbi:MAG: arginine--tRNA ligase [bacterium]|nr:arginine--tRNA ligase [bacterium]